MSMMNFSRMTTWKWLISDITIALPKNDFHFPSFLHILIIISCWVIRRDNPFAIGFCAAGVYHILSDVGSLLSSIVTPWKKVQHFLLQFLPWFFVHDKFVNPYCLWRTWFVYFWHSPSMIITGVISTLKFVTVLRMWSINVYKVASLFTYFSMYQTISINSHIFQLSDALVIRVIVIVADVLQWVKKDGIGGANSTDAVSHDCSCHCKNFMSVALLYLL